MSKRGTRRTGWLLLLALAAGVACVDPTLPRLPDGGDKDDKPPEDDQTGFHLPPPPPFYLV